MQKPKLPGWLDQVLQELMKPPYFLEKTTKGENKQTDAKNQSEKKSSSDEKPQVAVSQIPQKSSRSKSGERSSSESSIQTDNEFRGLNYVTFMDNAMQSHLAAQYAWKLNHVNTQSNIIRVDTDKGAYAVKETHVTPKHVEFLRQALQYAEDNGFSKYAPFALTKAKKAYIRKDDKTIYATTWIEGAPVNFVSLEQIGQTAYSLAEFHEATRGFQPKDYKPQMVYDLARIAKERNRDLRQMIQNAQSKTNPDAFDTLLVELKSNLQDDAAESIELLESAECEAFLASDKSNPGLCHLDVIPGNFIAAKNHHVYILDFDLAAFAPRAMDISHLLRRSMQQLHWFPDTAYTCFLHYNAVQPMQKVEYDIVYALLRFPYMAWRLANTHYQFFREETQIEELITYQTQEQKRQSFLSEFTKQITNLGATV